ncbi:MAG TPA: VacJ family lipoprotein [Acidiferrobacteraceae bacterium]|nr:VacJ family lipoprotein [Acidiferrobacteraceae bacterium]
MSRTGIKVARMCFQSQLRAVLSIVAFVGVSACATAPKGHASDFISADADPWQGFNQKMFRFNAELDHYAIRPAAKGYARVVPPPLRLGLTQAFRNLEEPGKIVNDALQWRWHRVAVDSGRFLVNSTLGVLGLVDVATPLGLEAQHQDFGMTLAKWGVHSGPYLVLPLFGPSDLRDGFGTGVDLYSSPTAYVRPASTRWSLYGLNVINTRTRLFHTGNLLQQAAGGDQYSFVREAYRQRRQYELSQGQPAPPPPPPPF